MRESTWETDLRTAKDKEYRHKLRKFYPDKYEKVVKESQRKSEKAMIKRLKSNPETAKKLTAKNTEKQLRYRKKILADPERAEEFRKKQNEYQLKSYYKKMADPERAAEHRAKRREYAKRRYHEQKALSK